MSLNEAINNIEMKSLVSRSVSHVKYSQLKGVAVSDADDVCVSAWKQETHYASATKPNRLTLFRETVAVYCENHTEHTDI
jgi:hypothetical protein